MAEDHVYPKRKAGYEYLIAWKITVPIYDYTVEFCRRYKQMLSSPRTYDQMVQSARSGMANIAEGNLQNSMEGYIKLTGVNRGSLEELLKDYQAFARQNRIEVWDKNCCRREIREIGKIWEILIKSPTRPAKTGNRKGFCRERWFSGKPFPTSLINWQLTPVDFFSTLVLRNFF